MKGNPNEENGDIELRLVDNAHPVPSDYACGNRLDGFRGHGSYAVRPLHAPHTYSPQQGPKLQAGETAMTNRCIFRRDRTPLNG